MNFETLDAFKELTKDLNMTKTASRLFISQQTLSNQIIRLEKELGVQLFERKPKLKLTIAGQHVLKCTLFTGHPVRRVHFALYD